MSTKKIAVLNTGSAILQQFVNVILQFGVRKIVLAYLGVEILGINSTFASIVAAASLAESGATNVIIFKLYTAVQNKDEDDINSLVNITRFFMMIIAILVLVATLILMPFIPKLLTKVKITPRIYVYFLLQSAATIASYLLSYKRVLLTADRVVYIGTFIDTITNIVFSLLIMVIVVKFKSYEGYLILCAVQVVMGNLIIHFVCKKKYGFLKYKKADVKRLKRMIPEFKDLFMGSLASYLYKSSDNLIISKFVNTISVGYLGNYTTITSALKQFALASISTMGPILGNKAAKKDGLENFRNVFRFYDFMLYAITLFIVIPEYVLLKNFVTYVWGAEYVMSNSIVVFLIVDQYLVIVQDCNGVLLSVVGKFKELKIADGVAAILNLLISIALVFDYGILGVLFGTIISRLIQWILKAYYCHIKYFGEDIGSFFFYWVKNFIKFILCILAIFVAMLISNNVSNIQSIINFVIVGFQCEILAGIVLVVYGIITKDLFVTLKLVGLKK